MTPEEFRLSSIAKATESQIRERLQVWRDSLLPLPSHHYRVTGAVQYPVERGCESPVQRLECSEYPVSRDDMADIELNIRAYFDEAVIQQVRERGLSTLRAASIPESRAQPHPINNTACHYYSNSPYLRCAVNPKGTCKGCKDFAPKLSPDSSDNHPPFS